ncbi:MAG: 5'-3' exonuclease H3TH domain-containing protein [Patescibacteria group bacterium]|nr:5'-3' exonuclease H3TH domain-containing protein [Patescibacteria group bacterium]
MQKFIIIDGNALIHRAYHALPPLKTKEGKLVNAVYGFTSILFRVIKDLAPDYLAVTFDLAGPTFRDLEYKNYKAKRIRPPQELYDQIPLVKEIVKVLSIPIFEKKGFEADDVIGTIIQKIKDNPPTGGIKNIIVTGDLDMLQLVDKQTEVYTFKKGIKDAVIYDEKAIKKRYGLLSNQLIDFRGLKGDPSDNIPGVPGIGEKTAIDLIRKFVSLDGLYKRIEASDLNPKIRARLLEYKEEALFSRYLSKIKKDVPIVFDLAKCRFGKFNRGELKKLLESWGFNSLIKRLDMIQ